MGGFTLSNPWLFFILVFCWTWSFWLSAAVLGTSVQTSPGKILLYLGLLGPALGGIVFIYLTQDRIGRREYWLRIVDVKRIPGKWYGIIFLFVPVLMAIALFLDVVSGGSEPLEQVGDKLAPFLSAPLTIIPFALGVFVRGPLPEELGWRGYVLDRLQSRCGALLSSLILGTIWSLWHLPLFFIQGMDHQTQGIWSPWFWQFMVAVVPMAIILTWIFNNTRKSTLAAILFHFMANLCYTLGNATPGTNFYSTLLWIIAAIAVVTFWGPGNLVRRK